LLTDPRQVQTTSLEDGLWSRVLDVPAALAARTYAVEIDVVLDVRDDFLQRGGRVRLHGGPEGATCTPTDLSADLALPVATLGPLLFGGGRASTYARAGRATGTPGALRRVDAAFATDREPLHGTGF
jgi:predicted acetyltransferase